MQETEMQGHGPTSSDINSRKSPFLYDGSETDTGIDLNMSGVTGSDADTNTRVF